MGYFYILERDDKGVKQHSGELYSTRQQLPRPECNSAGNGHGGRYVLLLRQSGRWGHTTPSGCQNEKARRLCSLWHFVLVCMYLLCGSSTYLVFYSTALVGQQEVAQG